jgi:hypothetical protein
MPDLACGDACGDNPTLVRPPPALPTHAAAYVGTMLPRPDHLRGISVAGEAVTTTDPHAVPSRGLPTATLSQRQLAARGRQHVGRLHRGLRPVHDLREQVRSDRTSRAGAPPGANLGSFAGRVTAGGDTRVRANP